MRMKRILVIFMAAMLLTGCGGGDTDSSSSSSGSGGYVFETDGVEIAMNAEASDIIDALGEYKDYFESESCAFDGLDKEYTYNGFVITTYPLDDVDYISSVELVDDTVETQEGIAIGSSLDDVVSAYGESDSETSCEYELDDSELLIILEDGTVTSIQYIAVTE